jgi:hypothetical protein
MMGICLSHNFLVIRYFLGLKLRFGTWDELVISLVVFGIVAEKVVLELMGKREMEPIHQIKVFDRLP